MSFSNILKDTLQSVASNIPPGLEADAVKRMKDIRDTVMEKAGEVSESYRKLLDVQYENDQLKEQLNNPLIQYIVQSEAKIKKLTEKVENLEVQVNRLVYKR